MGTILSLISGALGLFNKLMDWARTSRDQQTGAQKQALSESVASAKAEGAIAQAEASAPKTSADIDKRLGNGTF